jgi:hypothetical protein
MTASPEPAPAMEPEDLGEFFLERANDGDVEGLVALYEPVSFGTGGPHQVPQLSQRP